MPRKRDYAVEYARRKERARAEGYASFYEKRARGEQRNAPVYYELSDREQAAWQRAFRALTEMEKGASLSQAAKIRHTTPGIVRRYMVDRLERRGSRWALSGEYLQRRGLKVRIATEDGVRELFISDPATRSEYATYLSYVGMFFSDDPHKRQIGIRGLNGFKGRTFVDASGQEHPYITDRKLLIQLEEDGRLDIQGFYAEMAK